MRATDHKITDQSMHNVMCLIGQTGHKNDRFTSQNDAKAGHVVLVNSSCGHWVPKLSAVHFYSASKFAVKSLAEGFRQEVVNRIILSRQKK